MTVALIISYLMQHFNLELSSSISDALRTSKTETLHSNIINEQVKTVCECPFYLLLPALNAAVSETFIQVCRRFQWSGSPHDTSTCMFLTSLFPTPRQNLINADPY